MDLLTITTKVPGTSSIPAAKSVHTVTDPKSLQCGTIGGKKPPLGIEPRTAGLQDQRSTTEL